MDQGMGISIWQLLALVIYPLMIFILVLPFWRITAKAGYNPWLSLLTIIPVVNLIFLYFIAFSNWPSLRKE